jgi:hypothetical protein
VVRRLAHEPLGWRPVILRVITVLAPRGTAPDVIPISTALSVWAPLIGALMLRVSKLLVEDGAILERRLQSRGNGSGYHLSPFWSSRLGPWIRLEEQPPCGRWGR